MSKYKLKNIIKQEFLMPKLSFGDKLILLRKKKNISQKELAHLLNISVNNLPRYEKNDYLPKPEILLQLSKFFDVSIDYLLWDDQEIQERINFKDEEFLSLIKEIDRFPEKERNSLKNLIKSYLESQN